MTNSAPAAMAGVGDIQNYLGYLNQQVEALKTENRTLQGQMGELGRVMVTDAVTEDWLQVPFRFVTITSGSTGIVTRTVGGDGPFDLIEISFTSISSAGVTNDSWRILIKEGESVGRTLTQDQQAVDLANTAGTAQRPYIIKGRRRFRANIAIQVEATNTLAGPATNSLELVMHGIKLFLR